MMRHILRTPHVQRQIALVMLLLAVSPALGACGNSGAVATLDPTADPGERIFVNRCAACHARGTEAGYGPGLAGLFSLGGPTLPDSVDYGGNLPNGAPITDTNVAAWIREGGAGRIGRMPGIPLNDQEMADLLAYLKTLEP